MLTASGAAGSAIGAESPSAGAQSVLDVRARAILAGDKRAFMATVDPEAAPGFKAAQERQFDGLSSLRLGEYQLEVHTEETGDLSAASRDLYPTADRVFLPETRQRWRLEGIDTGRVLDRMWLTYVERGGSWFVAADSDVSDLGLTTSPGLWDGGRIELRRTQNVFVLSHPDSVERAQALADLTEASLSRVGWTSPWPGQILVILPSSPEELAKIIMATLDVEKFVAFVSYDSERAPQYEVSAPVMYVQDKNLSRYSTRFQTETLIHELVHAAAAPVSASQIPSWVHEGVADWIATGRRVNERRPAGSDGVVPRDFELSTGSRQSIITAYAESRSIISYLAGRAGPESPTAFFTALGKMRTEPGSVAYLTDQALRAPSGGMDLAALQAAWAAR